MSEKNENYVRKEILEHNGVKEPNSHERLKMFHHHTGHLDTLLRSFNNQKDTKDKTPIVQTLNALLSYRGIGGKNGGSDQKAYFGIENGSVVLIINTIANGLPNSNLGDLEMLLRDIDTTVSKQQDGANKGTVDQVEIGKNLARFNKILKQAETQAQKLDRQYQDGANDFSMTKDAIDEFVGKKSRKQTFDDNLRALQSKVFKDYSEFSEIFGPKNLPKHDQLIFEFQKRRFNALLSQKIESPESFTHYLFTNKQSLVYGWEGLKGEAVGTTEAVFGIFIFLYEALVFSGKYLFISKYRKETHQQISKISTFACEGISTGKFTKEAIIKLIEAEFDKIKATPPEEQAYMIGKIAGNIIGTIAGGKILKKTLQSDMFRTSYKAIEGERFRVANATTWKQLDAAIEQIDHIRFKEGLEGGSIQKLVDEVKMGTRSVSELPVAGGLQDKVGALKKYGGIIPGSTGIRKVVETSITKTKVAVEKTTARSFKIMERNMPEAAKLLEDAAEKAKTLTKTGYDRVDKKITQLRTKIDGAVDTAKGATVTPIVTLVTQIKEDIALLEFPGKNGLLSTLDGIGKACTQAREVLSSAKEKIQKPFKGKMNHAKPLSKEAIEHLRFHEGFAIEEIKNTEGKIFHQYRDVHGKVAFEGKFQEASPFHEGQATVKTENGLGIIDKQGGWIIKPKYDVLHRMSENIQVGKVNNKYVILKGRMSRMNGDDKIMWRKEKDQFDFMTDPREGMATAIKRTEVKEIVDGVETTVTKELRYIIDEKGKVRHIDYKFVDDFSSDGIAAVEDPSGMWHIIDRKGKRVGNIEAPSNLEAIDQHTMEKFRLEGKHTKLLKNRAKKLLRWDGYDDVRGLLPLQKEGTFLTEVELNGKVKKGFIDVYSKGIVAPQYDVIHASDGHLGFFRVKQDGKWGIINEKGETIVGVKYDGINIQDDILHTMEVRIGDRMGLIDKMGNELIPVEFSDILSPRAGTYQGVIYGENHVPLKFGELKDFSKELGISTNIEKDFTGKVVDRIRDINLARSAEKRGARTYQEETSAFIKEMEHLSLREVLVGFNNTQKSLSIRFTSLAKEIHSAQNMKELNILIEKTVNDEFDTYVKNYRLLLNEGKKLTKDERKILEQKRGTIIEELQKEIKNKIKERYRGQPTYDIEQDETKKLLNRFTKELNPRIYDSFWIEKTTRAVTQYGT